MAELEANIGGMQSAAGKESQIQSKLNNLSRRLDNCSRQLKTSMSPQYGDIRQQIANVNAKLQTVSRQTGTLSEKLGQIYALYSEVETEISGISLKSEKVSEAQDFSKTKVAQAGDAILDALIAFTLKVLGKTGAYGEYEGMLHDLGKSDDPVKMLFQALSTLISMVGKGATMLTGETPAWTKFIFHIPTDGKTSFWNGISKEVGEYTGKSYQEAVDKGTASAFGTKAATVAKWCGAALTIGTTAYDNYKEYEKDGGLQNTRFWEETVLESVLKIGGGAVVTAALGALAPAWTAAVAGAALAVGADMISEAVFGKGVTELVSDAVLDAKDWVVSKVTAAKDKVVAGWNSITCGWRSAFGW